MQKPSHLNRNLIILAVITGLIIITPIVYIWKNDLALGYRMCATSYDVMRGIKSAIDTNQRIIAAYNSCTASVITDAEEDESKVYVAVDSETVPAVELTGRTGALLERAGWKNIVDGKYSLGMSGRTFEATIIPNSVIPALVVINIERTGELDADTKLVYKKFDNDRLSEQDLRRYALVGLSPMYLPYGYSEWASNGPRSSSDDGRVSSETFQLKKSNGETGPTLIVSKPSAGNGLPCLKQSLCQLLATTGNGLKIYVGSDRTPEVTALIDDQRVTLINARGNQNVNQLQDKDIIELYSTLKMNIAARWSH